VSKLGYRINRFSAAELHVGTGVKEGESRNTEAKPVGFGALYFRLGSRLGSKLRLFALLGMSSMTIDISGDRGTLRLDFSGVSWGVGAEERLKIFKDMIAYMRYHSSEGEDIDGVSVGFKVDFQ